MKKLILILILGSLFADDRKQGFGFSFEGGNTIMKLFSNNFEGLSTSALSPTIYFPQNLPFGKVEPFLSYYSIKYKDSNILKIHRSYGRSPKFQTRGSGWILGKSRTKTGKSRYLEIQWELGEGKVHNYRSDGF